MALALASLGSVATVGAVGSGPQRSGAAAAQAGLIAFERVQGTNSDIFTMTPLGRSQRRLTTWKGADFSPSWNSRGRIAFVSDRSGSFELFMMTATGTRLRRLTKGSRLPKNSPDWAPDERRIAFAGGRARRADVYVIRPPSSKLFNATRNPADDSAPAWSVRGTEIVFSSDRGGGRHLYLYTLDSRRLVPLTAGPGADFDPAWAPDGTRIAFTRVDAAGNYDVWTLDLGSRRERRLTSDTAQDRDPSWSPDGSAIAFVTNRDVTSDYEIYVMMADGSSPHNISHAPRALDLSPDWSSASVRLAPFALFLPASRALEIAAATCEIEGDSRNNYLEGTDSADVICGGKGDDTILAGGGDDDIRGGPGNDQVWGGRGKDTIDGGPGRDTLKGGRAGDTFYPGAGRDNIDGGRGKSDRCIFCDPGDRVVNVEVVSE